MPGRSPTYHPNGAVARFKYGNGIVHTTSQNARGLPYQSTDVGVINDIYTYDGNANPVGIADQLPPSTSNRAMFYDNLDRVTLARAPGCGAMPGTAMTRWTTSSPAR